MNKKSSLEAQERRDRRGVTGASRPGASHSVHRALPEALPYALRCCRPSQLRCQYVSEIQLWLCQARRCPALNGSGSAEAGSHALADS